MGEAGEISHALRERARRTRYEVGALTILTASGFTWAFWMLYGLIGAVICAAVIVAGTVLFSTISRKARSARTGVRVVRRIAATLILASVALMLAGVDIALGLVLIALIFVLDLTLEGMLRA